MVYLGTINVIWIKHIRSHLLTLYYFAAFQFAPTTPYFICKVRKLREILKRNNYSSGIIEQFIKSFLNKLYVPKKVIATVPKKQLFIVLPYLGTSSSNIKRKLRTCFKNSLPHCNSKIILKSTNHLSSLFDFKDVIPKELQSHTEYKFSCGNCIVTYYGNTRRHLNVISNEHISISYLTRNRVQCKPSAVPDHLLLHKHDGDFSAFTILCQDNIDFRLLLKESI